LVESYFNGTLAYRLGNYYLHFMKIKRFAGSDIEHYFNIHNSAKFQVLVGAGNGWADLKRQVDGTWTYDNSKNTAMSGILKDTNLAQMIAED